MFDSVTAIADSNRIEIQNKTSDVVNKINIEDEYLGTDFVKQVRPGVFEHVTAAGREIQGFLANQVAALTSGKNTITAWKQDGAMEMDYISMVSPLYKAFQEAEARVTTLENDLTTANTKIATLESQMATVMAQIAALQAV